MKKLIYSITKGGVMKPYDVSIVDENSVALAESPTWKEFLEVTKGRDSMGFAEKVEKTLSGGYLSYTIKGETHYLSFER